MSLPTAPQRPVVPTGIMQLGLGLWGAKTLLSAIDFGVFTVLAGGPKTLPELRTELDLHASSARDFLDALVVLRLLERRDGRYRNTRESDTYLDRGKSTYVGGMLQMANARLYGFWGNLEALRSGVLPAEPTDDADPLATVYADPAKLEVFLRAMTGVSRPDAKAIAAAFPWSEHRRFVDVGCAEGVLDVTVARAHPHLTGLGFDRPPLREAFECAVREQGLADRVRFAAGNFFRDPLPDADVVVIGQVLRDLNVDEKHALIANAFGALPRGGVLLVYDTIVEKPAGTTAPSETPGLGHTGPDCIGWMQDAGFRTALTANLAGPGVMVVAVK